MLVPPSVNNVESNTYILMKRSIALAIAILTSPVLSSFAGEPVASWKNPIAPPSPVAPVEELYRAHELQADFFGAYAVTPDTGNRARRSRFFLHPDIEQALEEELGLPVGNGIPAGTKQANRFLGNHAWGGGGAINYFFTRNFGVGLEGTALRATGENEEVSGQFGMNLLARLPINNTGWAPYAMAGIGGFIPGNNGNVYDSNWPGRRSTILNAIASLPDRYRARLTVRDKNVDNILIEGHVGLGAEYRFTKNIGIFTDGRFTFVEKAHNNYGLVRTGIRFAF